MGPKIVRTAVHLVLGQSLDPLCVGYSASNTKVLAVSSCFYLLTKSGELTLSLLWRALKERQERRGRDYSFPALSSKNVQSNKWQAPGNLGPVLSSLRNPAETARNEGWQQVGLTSRMSPATRTRQLTVNLMSSRQMGTAVGIKPCPRTEL